QGVRGRSRSLTVAARAGWGILRKRRSSRHSKFEGASMQLGINFPADHSLDDPSAVRDYAQAVEELGFSYLTVVDHVLGADISGRPDWNAPYSYTHQSIVREAIVLLGFLAACTRRIVLGT